MSCGIDGEYCAYEELSAEMAALTARLARAEAVVQAAEAVALFDDWTLDAEDLCSQCRPPTPGPFVAARKQLHQALARWREGAA